MPMLSNASIVGELLPYAPTILELVQRSLADSDRTESTVRLAIGLIGDLADSFPNGDIKSLLLTEWIAVELRSKGRGHSPETKRTIKWAREVSAEFLEISHQWDLMSSLSSGRQACYGVVSSFSSFFFPCIR